MWTSANMSPIDSLFADIMRSSPQSITHHVSQTDDALSIEFDLPGVRREDIKLQVVDRNMKLVATRAGKSRSIEFKLASNLIAEKTSAALADGVLTVKIPLKAIESFDIAIS